MDTELDQLIPVGWQARQLPLEATAVAASGRAASVLARRVAALEDQLLSQLRGVAGGDYLVVLGETQQLPWTPGVEYLGRDPAAPQLLLPTAIGPNVPADLLQQGLLERFSSLDPPLVVLGQQQRVLSVRLARAIDRAELLAWAERGD